MRYLGDATSTLKRHTMPNRLHRLDPHGEEGQIDCLFDLQCQRLAMIMRHLQAVPRNRYLPVPTFNKFKHFGGPKRQTKLVSDLTGRSVFRQVLLVWRGLPFSTKGGLAVPKRGPVPPFSLKKGARAPFLKEKGVPAKKMIPKCTDQDFLWYQYGKYQEIPIKTERKILIRYTTLLIWQIAKVKVEYNISKLCSAKINEGIHKHFFSSY